MGHTTSASAVTAGTPQVGSSLCFSQSGKCDSQTSSSVAGSSSNSPASPAANQTAMSTNTQYPFTIEGIRVRMSMDQVRAAAKAEGSIKGPLKQGPVTYNLMTRDLSWQIEFTSDMHVTSYNVSERN